MPEIKFSISPQDLALYSQAKSNYKSSLFTGLSDEEKIEALLKVISMEETYDAEMESDLLEEIGWYDIDFDEPDSRFQKFLDEEGDDD